MNRYYYTFGTDPAFPYKKGWVEVRANTMKEADEKFRRRFPDRHPELCVRLRRSPVGRDEPGSKLARLAVLRDH